MQAPTWFTRALGAPAQSHFVEVDGAPIHYLTWNAQDTDKPGLLFVHGFRAHARWWSFIAPFFLSRFRVAAMDFGGMGDSGTRPAYEIESCSREIIAVLEAARLGRATVVGHSFGGGRVLTTCATWPGQIERAVILDSYVPVPGVEPKRGTPPPLRPKKIYPTCEAARARFRLVPEQNSAMPYVLDYVARHSMKEVTGGWSWKFDETFMPRLTGFDVEKVRAMLARIDVPVTIVYGELSAVVSREHAHALVRCLPLGRGPIAIPQSHHHVMLDQPLSLVATLRALLY
jgi:pimeloyl-ACP methyl ester carboxylesterase